MLEIKGIESTESQEETIFVLVVVTRRRQGGSSGTPMSSQSCQKTYSKRRLDVKGHVIKWPRISRIHTATEEMRTSCCKVQGVGASLAIVHLHLSEGWISLCRIDNCIIEVKDTCPR